ncbi:MAG: hypothetical protein ACYCXP_06240 [Leptospirillum sp.]|jgi:hypothetical protein|nr:hypothetical protein [Nitrospiraceae bacterium]
MSWQGKTPNLEVREVGETVLQPPSTFPFTTTYGGSEMSALSCFRIALPVLLFWLCAPDAAWSGSLAPSGSDNHRNAPANIQPSSEDDLLPDIDALMKPDYLSWGPLTSGPFFTGNANTVPVGSFFVRSAWSDNLMFGQGLNLSSMTGESRIDIGVMKNLEMDLVVPIGINSQNSAGTGNQRMTEWGVGDTVIFFRYNFLLENDVTSLWHRPSLTIEPQFVLPTGKYTELNPTANGLDQTGNGTFNEGLYLIAKKSAKPFRLFFMAGDVIQNPTTVGANYASNNVTFTPIPCTASGQCHTGRFNMVDGNLLDYSLAVEHILNDHYGLGYVLELVGQTQTGSSLFFGNATVPSWSFLWAAPSVEATYPNTGKMAVTWSVGVALPLYQSNIPEMYTPFGMATVWYNGVFGYRGE